MYVQSSQFWFSKVASSLDSVGIKLRLQVFLIFKPYIKGNKISGSPKSISNYERPERDEFTELPGSDKEEGGVAWRAYAAVNGGEIDGAPASVFPEEFQGTLCNNKKSAERKIFS